MKLREAIARLEIALTAKGNAPRTVRWYTSHLKRLLEFFGEDQPVENITLDDLRRFAAHLYERDYRYRSHPGRPEEEGGLSLQTIYGCIRATRFLFKFLWEEGYISENPAARLLPPRLPDPQPRGISLEARAALLTAARTARDRALVLFLADTGCRVREVVNLKRCDLDLEQRMAIVRGKGGKVRAVFISEETARALEEYLREQGDGYLEQAVFIGQHGPLTETGVYQVLKRLRERAKVSERCNPHAFRHGFARDYLLDGGDMATLANLLGHSDVKVTKMYYAVFEVRELQRAHDEHSPVVQMKRKGLL